MAMKSSSQPSFSIVFFNLKITGYKVTDEMIQIAARCGSAAYDKYVIPTVEIPKKKTDSTGISISDNQMYHHGKPVDAVSQADAIKTLIDFLETIGDKVVLVAHNCFNTDGPLLAGTADKHGMIKRFKKVVVGFSDPMPLLRRFLPRDRETGKGYKLRDLAQEFLGSPSGAYDAIMNATSLEKLVVHEKINITADNFINSREIVEEMTDIYKNRLNKHKRDPEFDTLDDWYYYPSSEDECSIDRDF